jgi:hypothetical protein
MLLLRNSSTQHLPWSWLLTSWLGWDGANYASIATHGYDVLWKAAYFPLFPMVEHVTAPVAGGNTALAGLFCNLVFSFLAFGLLRVLAEREYGRAVARRCVLYLALFPTALFLFAPYTEALFLLLSVAAFLALRRANWPVAGLLIALATLNRPQGLILLLPLAAEYLQRNGYLREARYPRLRRAIVWIAPDTEPTAVTRTQRAWQQRLPALAAAALLPLLAFASFTLYLHGRFGLWNASTLAQQIYWDRGFAVPFAGLPRAVHALGEVGLEPSFFQAHILLDIVFTLAFIGLTIATLRRLPLAYIVYAWASLLLVLSTPGHNWYSLTADMRYMVVVFPLFLLLGRWGQRRGVELGILLGFLPLLAIFVVAYVTGHWVS